MKIHSYFLPVLLATVICSCASGNSIFPPVPVSTDVESNSLPNPISIVADPANNQIILANSNVDFIFEQGSLMTLSVDASAPATPALQITSAVATPSYAGNLAFDGVNLYVPFREASSDGANTDQIGKYTIGAGSISLSTTGVTSNNPFGVALSGTSLFVVGDNTINLFDTNLSSLESIDLNEAGTAGITDANAADAENIVVDVLRNRAFVSNRGGKMFVIDLNNNALTTVINHPTNTRGMASDGVYIYAVDGNSPMLWVLDPSKITESAPIQEVDVASLVVATLDLGANPNGIAVDPANARVYVANTGDHSVSVIDTNLFLELDRISLRAEDTGLNDAKEPFGIGVGTFNGVPFVFTANVTTNNLAVMNGNTLKVVHIFP